MSGESKQHPGRSVDFLSRLHDGELDPGERAHFEAHRAHCAECRRAALEFENALAMFRSARSRPPQADLAGRILRKIQTSPRSRAPFSLRFRTDLGWAALLLTGIFALLLSVRRPESPVVVSFPAPVPDAEVPAPAAPSSPQAADERDQLVPLPSREKRVRQAPPREASAARDSAVPESAAALPPAAAETKELRDNRAVEYDRGERRPAVAAEPGRAGGTQEEEPTAVVAAPASPLHLSIEPIDGYGSAPPLLSELRMAVPANYRGHEFILHVDSQGKVSEVRPGPAGKAENQDTARLAAPAPAALSELKFKPGNRPRRLLVRFE
ncbi:MAG: zf-HC2 domain-containing protein [Acidobacteriota bacterium]|nr:zf-HC2 domain-containing protein [Acidobacteriota bacterium]MDQ5873551.1 zf-HC2 domain-containing protein [Acidobacteriota bacterium]